jgi:hypothetical protein
MTQQFLPPFGGVPQRTQSESIRHEEGHEAPLEEEPEELPPEELPPEEIPPDDVPPEPEDVPPEELPPEEPLPEELPLPLALEPTAPFEAASDAALLSMPAGCASVPQATATPNTRHNPPGSLKSDKYFMRAFLLNARWEFVVETGRYRAA